MVFLTREKILAAKDIKTESLNVPEWGGDVLIKALSGAERDSFENDILIQKGKGSHINLYNIRAKLVALCLVDDAGDRLFSDADIKALGAKSASALQRVFEVAQRLAGITNEDVEELTKNSSEGQNGDSTSV